jgi:hypothetical protein
MKSLITAAALAGAAFLHTAPASAQESRIYSYCAMLGYPAEECIFDTWDECRQTVRGVGGMCYANPSLPRAQVDPSYGPAPRRR